MAWSFAGKTRGAYLFAIVVILVWIEGKVVVVEEGLETDGGELDDDEYYWWISGLDDWILVATIDEVVAKEVGFTTSEACEDTPRTTLVRATSLVDFWM